MSEEKIINDPVKKFGEPGTGKATEWLFGYREKQRTIGILFILAMVALVIARCSV